MLLIKYVLITITALMQIITFCLGANKYISANDKREKIEYMIITFSGLLGIILFFNTEIFLY